MKIVQLFKIYWPDNGGGVAAVMKMIADICNNSADTEQKIIVCQHKKGLKTSRDEFEGIQVQRCRQQFSFVASPISFSFFRYARREMGDAGIVIYHCPYPMVDVSILLKRLKGKLVVWWHADFDTRGKSVFVSLYKLLMGHTLKRADRIIVSAEGNIRGSEQLRRFEDKCVVIPFGVDEKLKKHGDEYCLGDRKDSRKGGDGNVHVLFMGRIVWYKGVDILLRAWKELDDGRYELCLVGAGKLSDEMKDLAKELNLRNVNFAGSVSAEEKEEWIKWSDFLVLPSVSKGEAFAIVQIEAMAFGKPVINTNLPSGVPEVSPDGISGITVKPKDVHQLAEAIKKLGEDKELREEYGKGAKKLVDEKYGIKRMEAAYRKLFEDLAG